MTSPTLESRPPEPRGSCLCLILLHFLRLQHRVREEANLWQGANISRAMYSRRIDRNPTRGSLNDRAYRLDWAERVGTGIVLPVGQPGSTNPDRKSTRLNSSHVRISYAVFCLKKKKNK